MLRNVFLRFKRLALLLPVLFLLGVSGAAAQVQQIEYGDSVIGAIADDGLPAQYVFAGETGDLVTLQVVSATPDFSPSLVLISPGQTQVVTAEIDNLNPESGLARLSHRLRETGAYLISVGSRTGSSGDFLLSLDMRSIEQAATLSSGILAQVDLQGGTEPQVFTFSLSPDSPTRLTITNETEGFTFSAEIRDNFGQVVSRLDRVVQSTQLEFPAEADSLYELTLAATTPNSAGTITLSLVAGTVSPSTLPEPPLENALNAATEEAAETDAEDESIEVDPPTPIPTATPSPTEPGPTATPTQLSPNDPSPFGAGAQQTSDSPNPTPTFTPLSPDISLDDLDDETPVPGATATFTLIPADLLPATIVLPTRDSAASTDEAAAGSTDEADADSSTDLFATAAPRPTAQPAGSDADSGAAAPAGATTSGEGGCTNRATFIADVTIPDGATIAVGSPFVKTWRLRNSGSCTWDNRYTFVKLSGELTSGFLNDSVSMPVTQPGQDVDISIVLAALTGSGTQRAVFQIRDPNGNFFGPQPYVLVNVTPQ